MLLTMKMAIAQAREDTSPMAGALWSRGFMYATKDALAAGGSHGYGIPCVSASSGPLLHGLALQVSSPVQAATLRGHSNSEQQRSSHTRDECVWRGTDRLCGQARQPRCGCPASHAPDRRPPAVAPAAYHRAEYAVSPAGACGVLASNSPPLV